MIDSSNFILIYGALRSGSTLLRLMLDGHPRLACPAESDFMFDHIVVRDGVWVIDADALERDFMYTYTNMTLSGGSAREQLASFAEQSRKGRDVGALVLHRGIERALQAFPGIRIVHLVRDPRDVAASSVPMGWAGNVYCGVDQWIQTEDEWSRIVHQLKPGQSIEVRFEDLIRSPQATLTRICALAGLDYDAAMLDYDKSTTYSKPDSGNSAKWRERLSPREIGMMEAKLGSRLTSRGYELSGHPLVPATALTDLAIRLQSKVKVWNHRVKKYGVVDTLIVAVARRLGMPGLANSAQKRIDTKLLSTVK